MFCVLFFIALTAVTAIIIPIIPTIIPIILQTIPAIAKLFDFPVSFDFFNPKIDNISPTTPVMQ